MMMWVYTYLGSFVIHFFISALWVRKFPLGFYAEICGQGPNGESKAVPPLVLASGMFYPITWAILFFALGVRLWLYIANPPDKTIKEGDNPSQGAYR